MIKRISSEELKKIKISKEEVEAIKNFKEDFSDPECPPLSKEQLSRFKRAKDVHPEWFKPKKVTITIRLDIDVVERYKMLGKGYQTKINSDLRKAAGLDY